MTATHTTVDSPLGELTLVAEEGRLTGVYFPHHWYRPDPDTFGPRADTGFEDVSAAVGRNPLSVVVPCHRVVGKDGRLTGYAGGLARKRFLLDLEGASARLY